MNAITEWAKAHGFNVPGNGDYWSPQEKANLVAAGMPKNLVSPVTDWAVAHGFNVPADGDYWGPDAIQNLIQAGMPQEIANQSGEYDAGTLQLNEKNRAQAQQAADNHGSGLGLAGTLAALAAAYFTGGSSLAFGLPDITNAFDIGGSGFGTLGADTAAFEAGGAGGLQNWGTLAADAATGGGMTLNSLPSFYDVGTPGLLDGASPLTGAAGSVLDSVAPAASGIGASGAALPAAWQSALGAEGAGSLAQIAGSTLDTAAKTTAIQRLLASAGITGTAADIAQVLGGAIPGLLGAYASSRATDQYKGLADQFASYGAPYRQRLSDLYANPSGFLSSDEVQKPVQMASDIMARSLSTQGNPTGSGNALQQLQSYSADQLFGRLGQEKDRLAGFGGLSAYNQAAPSAAASVIGSSNNTANALGAATNNIFSPPQTLAQQLAAFKTLSG